MSDLVTPLLKTLQHLLTSLREKANHSHRCTLPGLFPPWGPCMCCSFCPECSFPGSNMTCSFTPFRSPSQNLVLSENILGHPAKSTNPSPNFLFPSLALFSSLAFNIIYLIHYLFTKFLEEHVHIYTRTLLEYARTVSGRYIH